MKLKGVYVITDGKLIPRERFVEIVEKAARGGAAVIQLREKDSPEREIVRLGRELLPITRKYGVLLIINDSPLLAKEIRAGGVHLGKDDPPISEARMILGEKAVIGVSCYGKIEKGTTAEEQGADYVVFGTPFFTPTKPERKPTPFQVLIEAKRKIRRIPVFAIGGINRANAESVLETGVDGIAVITSVFGSSDPERATRELADLFYRKRKESNSS